MFQKTFSIMGWWTFGGMVVLFALAMIAVPNSELAAGIWFVRIWRVVSAFLLLLHLVVFLVQWWRSRHS